MANEAKVFNDDIGGLYNRCNRYITELYRSASANVSDVNPFDLTRTTAYLSELEKYTAWVVGQPALDLPETHPQQLTLADAPVVPDIENLMVEDIIRLMERGRDELILSQSARNATGLIKFDLLRWSMVLAKTNQYLATYVKDVTPVDLPESSPETAEQ